MPYNEGEKFKGDVLIMKWLTLWNLLKIATGIWLVKIVVIWILELFKK